MNGENLSEYSQDLINNKKTNLRECHLQALFSQLFSRLYDIIIGLQMRMISHI